MEKKIRSRFVLSCYQQLQVQWCLDYLVFISNSFKLYNTFTFVLRVDCGTCSGILFRQVLHFYLIFKFVYFCLLGYYNTTVRGGSLGQCGAAFRQQGAAHSTMRSTVNKNEEEIWRHFELLNRCIIFNCVLRCIGGIDRIFVTEIDMKSVALLLRPSRVFHAFLF